MPDIVENIIFVYSGLSSDPKPTLKTTGNLKNGSRFREVDTGITYYFNKETDQWYPFEYQSITVKGSKSVADIGASEILSQILLELKIMNTHLAVMTDEVIGENDVT